VRGDERELQRAVANLASNAIRLTPAGGSVVLTVRAVGADGVVRVADGCGGIPVADLPRLFDVGWRGTRARTPEDDTGAGLGLAVVSGIVKAHGGEVRVANTDVGCEFIASVPLASGYPSSPGAGHLTEA
jgi:signal transduction histidine kinase